MSPETLRVLQVLSEWVRAHGRGPTMRELAARAGLSSHGSARHHVVKLLRAGLVTSDRTAPRGWVAARTLELTPAGDHHLARWQRLHASSMLVGECGLALDAAGLRAARRAELPLEAFRTRVEGDRTIVLFDDRADRDFWALAVLDELE